MITSDMILKSKPDELNPLDLKGLQIPVLDKGFVQLVDFMGGDSAVVQAARVSYGAGTKTVSEDRGLIRYLMRHSHTTPFEMCEIKFLIKVPMDVWRQLIRHRTASVNEYSTRYSIAIDDIAQTHPDKWRLQSGSNKQGSEGFVTEFPKGHPARGREKESGRKAGWDLSQTERDFHSRAKEVYQQRLDFGVAREQARKDLPLSNYTEAYWKIDLHNLFHFLSLRLDGHAQYEIRQYAEAIAAFTKQVAPMSYEAFVDYDKRQEGLLLSRMDVAMINVLLNESSNLSNIKHELVAAGFYNIDKGDEKITREGTEFLSKLDRLGVFYEPIQASQKRTES